MRYKHLILHAYTLIIHNPLYWLFGLVLLGGFNLYLVNFFALLQVDEWATLPPVLFNFVRYSDAAGIATFILGSAALFVVVNLIKIIFIVTLHSRIHARSENETERHDPKCLLCTFRKDQALPYFTWLKRVMLSSALTITVTSGLTLAIHSIISMRGYDQAAIVFVNLIVISVISCAAGAWNLFTSYFIVMHGLKFVDSASSAVSLMVLRIRHIVEFLVILSLIYTLAVFIGDGFIGVWQHGFAQNTAPAVRISGLTLFFIWFIGNNTFFNVAMLVFFDRLVKAKPVVKELRDGHLQPNVLN